MSQQNIRVVINENKRPVGEHARRYNSPMCDEVGVLMPNDNVNNRDIVLHYRDGSLQRISELHRGYDPLQYPLLFSYGTDGWHINLKLANGRKLTAMVYYRYHIMVRQQVPVLLKAKRLFQQFLVDAYCKIETERLQFLRREQKALRADCYQDLWDAMVDGDGDPRNVGRRVILPSSFTGGPRYMHERQQDAMTYVRKYGHPDLFITMTTNPNWPEIRNNLLPGQEPLDRPDLVARVFRLKVKKLLEMLTKEMIFGKPQAWLYSTEWQKRGLPHCHLLQWLIPEHKITPDKIDDVICAPIIILRSLDPPRVTNGTRCVVTKLLANTVEAKISHGRYAGHDIIIPRIPLILSNSVLPFEFRRLQFPIALCFAMTINKSQGQTFKAVGLDLTDESFTHGMLYVALSRVGSADRLTLLVRGDCKTRNVVYSEVFR